MVLRHDHAQQGVACVSRTGFYVNVDELCIFYALGPDTPWLTLGGPGTISFYADSATGCTPTNG